MSITFLLEQNKQQIIQDYKNGISTTKLGEQYDCNRGLIYTTLKNWGINIPKRQQFKGKVEDYSDEIIKLFNEHNSIHSIANKLGISEPTISRFLKSKGLNTSIKKTVDSNNLLKDKKDLVIEMYKTMSMDEIAEEIGHSQSCIWKLLNDAGIETSDTYNVDIDFFKKMDIEEKWWVLGWLYSDGNVNETRMRINLQARDIDVLEKIKYLMKYDGPLHFKKSPKETWQDQYELCIGRGEIVEDLKLLGCVPAKSNILEWPKNLPEEFVWAFLRGIFEGDGSIGGTRGLQITFTGSKIFNKDLLTFLRSVGIQCQEYFRADKEHSSQIMTTKISESMKLMRLLYNNPTIYMNRKYQKWAEYCKSKALAA